ncbi:hypothetical protein AFLA_003566 [Aspergillus flavus NRRL3357]|nr:hypothetical protein AFLA_003566 [Aspergillus flavus NRRL3357]
MYPDLGMRFALKPSIEETDSCRRRFPSIPRDWEMSRRSNFIPCDDHTQWGVFLAVLESSFSESVLISRTG